MQHSQLYTAADLTFPSKRSTSNHHKNHSTQNSLAPCQSKEKHLLLLLLLLLIII